MSQFYLGFLVGGFIGVFVGIISIALAPVVHGVIKQIEERLVSWYLGV